MLDSSEIPSSSHFSWEGMVSLNFLLVVPNGVFCGLALLDMQHSWAVLLTLWLSLYFHLSYMYFCVYSN